MFTSDRSIAEMTNQPPACPRSSSVQALSTREAACHPPNLPLMPIRSQTFDSVAATNSVQLINSRVQTLNELDELRAMDSIFPQPSRNSPHSTVASQRNMQNIFSTSVTTAHITSIINIQKTSGREGRTSGRARRGGRCREVSDSRIGDVTMG